MRRIFIVNGPESSGNRLVGAILLRAGCWGEASTNQPKTISDIPKEPNQVVWIHPGNFKDTIPALKTVFDEVTVILVIREPEANCRSMVRVGFFQTLKQANIARINKIQETINTALESNCKLEIITYEGLSTPMLRLWLPRLGLPVDNLNQNLKLVGQLAPTQIRNRNGKYY